MPRGQAIHYYAGPDGRPIPFTWSDDRFDHLKTRWKEGASASEIANEIGHGCSRNAVIGKVHRNSLSRPRAAIRESMKTAKHNTRKTAMTPFNPAYVPAPKINPKPHVTKLAPVVPSDPRTLVDLPRYRACRYPVGGEGADTLFCAEPAEETYCPGHDRLCRTPVVRKYG